MPPLGLITVAALLPREWTLRLLDLNVRPLNDDDWDWADLVMISGMIIQKDGVLSLIRLAKQQGKPVAVGGPYVTSLSHEVLEAGPDFLIRGEAEVVMPDFLAALDKGIKSGVFEKDQRPDMTTSPVPRFDLVNFQDYLTMSIQTSRGCPFNCEFCDIVKLYGRVPRYKAPGQVLQEIETLYRLGWRETIFISDDNFIGNKDHARAILTEMIPWMQSRGEPFSFWTQASVNLGQDLEMIDLMTAANFNHIFLGVETPEPELLAAANKYQNLRNPLAQSLKNINMHGLSMIASFVMGFDHEKPGTGDRICKFVEDNGIPIVMLNRLQALPNTDLWDRLKQEGRLLDVQLSGDSFDLGFNFIPSRPPADILQEYVQAIDRLYEPSRYLARAYRYFLQMRPTRKALSPHKDKENRKIRTIKAVPTQQSAQDWKKLIAVLWKHGVRWPYRWQFWRQLWGIYRHNPSRLRSYIICCVMIENLLDIREDILRKWAASKLSAK